MSPPIALVLPFARTPKGGAALSFSSPESRIARRTAEIATLGLEGRATIVCFG